MTDMRRVTISLPEDIDKRILRLKKTNKFVRDSYSEIVRQLLLKGLEKETKDLENNGRKRPGSGKLRGEK